MFPSARHAGRTPAWSSDGSIARSNTGGDVCMLTPVHEPNFQHLARRLLATDRMSIGPPPTTVVVFDDEVASQKFCRMSKVCALQHFAKLELKALLGDKMYARAQLMLKTGGWQDRERLKSHHYGDDALASSCAPKFGGQCYQSLKKFYGAAEGPAHCQYYWVSDAESYPFRQFNFTALVAHTFSGRWYHAGLGNGQHARQRHKPFLLVPSWSKNRYGCTATINLFDDGDCSKWITSSLLLGRGATLNASARSEDSDIYQTVYDLNNWWFYERQMARAVIDRTEALRGQHFVEFFAPLQVPDILFWRANFQHLVRQRGAAMVTRDVLYHVEKAFPAAFAACCSCHRPGATSSTLPCYSISHLWDKCFMAHAKPHQVASFLVEQLGIFGVYGSEMDSMPDEILQSDHRLSWVVNNAYKWRNAQRWKYGTPTLASPHVSRAVSHSARTRLGKSSLPFQHGIRRRQPPSSVKNASAPCKGAQCHRMWVGCDTSCRQSIQIKPPGASCGQYGEQVSTYPLGSGSGVCVLLATSTRSPTDERTPNLLERLESLCDRHGWIRVVLNFYDATDTLVQVAGRRLNSCISTTFVPGFKTIMWKYVLNPSMFTGNKAYTHIWLVDSDMDVHPDRFDFVAFMRIAEATNVSILSPSPYGGGNGMYAMDDPRCMMRPSTSKCERYCQQNPARLCAVCRQPVVEVKTPMFTEVAWRAFHEKVLRHIPDHALATSDNFDKHWCNLMVHLVHGCDWLNQSNSCRLKLTGSSCAYSYATPLRHLNENTNLVHSTQFAEGQKPMEDWLTRHLSQFKTMPSWRASGSKLEVGQGLEGCMSADWLENASALRGWKMPDFVSSTDWRALAGPKARNISQPWTALRICRNEYCLDDGTPLQAQPQSSPSQSHRLRATPVQRTLLLKRARDYRNHHSSRVAMQSFRKE